MVMFSVEEGDFIGEVIMASSSLRGATSGNLRWSGRSCMVMFSVEKEDEGASDSRLLSCSPVLDMAFRPSMTVVIPRDRRFQGDHTKMTCLSFLGFLPMSGTLLALLIWGPGSLPILHLSQECKRSKKVVEKEISIVQSDFVS